MLIERASSLQQARALPLQPFASGARYQADQAEAALLEAGHPTLSPSVALVLRIAHPRHLKYWMETQTERAFGNV